MPRVRSMHRTSYSSGSNSTSGLAAVWAKGVGLGIWVGVAVSVGGVTRVLGEAVVGTADGTAIEVGAKTSTVGSRPVACGVATADGPEPPPQPAMTVSNISPITMGRMPSQIFSRQLNPKDELPNTTVSICCNPNAWNAVFAFVSDALLIAKGSHMRDQQSMSIGLGLTPVRFKE